MQLLLVKAVNYLGFHFGEGVQNIFGKVGVFAWRKAPCGIRMLLSFEATSQLIYALITTTLDYCNGILFNLPKKKFERLQRIQRIQNQAACMLKSLPKRNHITPVLKYLDWLE